MHRAGRANAVALDRGVRGVRARERRDVFPSYRVHADAAKVDVVVVFVFGFSIDVVVFDADDSHDARSGRFFTAHGTGSLVAVVLFPAVRWTAAGGRLR